MLSTNEIEDTRTQALRFFKADPEHFDLIFVANATAAIKLVAGCVADYSRKRSGFWYGYHADAHTSLVGIREVAAGSKCFQNDEEVEEWLSSRSPLRPGTPQTFAEDSETIGLFAYPGQSNMNGRRLPLDWPGRLRSSTVQGSSEVYSLLDAAALVSTASLDLTDHENAPDFTALSFYKTFGFPDLGALIVRKAAGHVLGQRQYFGGGTVDMVINGGHTKDDWYAKKATSLHEMLEDGTPAFHSIVALKVGLSVHRELFGSMANVSKYASALSKILYDEMSILSHANGLPVCQIYKGSSSKYGDSKTQGPTIAFNLRDSGGQWIGKSDFEMLAIQNGLQIRTGGLCNPGGIASSLNISPAQMRENFEEGVRCGNEIDEMHGKPTGVIRVSLGAMSDERDLSTFLKFLDLFVDKSAPGRGDLMATQADEPREKPALNIELQSPKAGYVAGVFEIPESFTCPVAACRRSVDSRDELAKHFLTHKASGRSGYPWRLHLGRNSQAG